MAQIRLIVIVPAGVRACSVKPPRDVEFTGNSQQYIITANMQGYRPEEIQVQVERSRTLVLSGQRRASLIFQQRYELPADARPDDAEAVWTRGTLTITIPKARLQVTNRVITSVPILQKRNSGGVGNNDGVLPFSSFV